MQLNLPVLNGRVPRQEVDKLRGPGDDSTGITLLEMLVVVALASEVPDRWQTPEFLSGLIGRGTRVRLDSGSEHRVDPEVRR